MPTSLDLQAMPAERLDELFKLAMPGPVPVGIGAGEVFVSPTRLGRVASRLIGAVIWRGKEFTAETGSLRNIISPFGLRTIAASVDEGPSLLDGRPAIVLDYSSTSKVACWVRDEIRQIAPGHYLGIVFVRGRRVPLRFSLRFPGPQPR